ncbi:dynamin family protein [uncultured Desulfovibrio sp.]|uniref:dynamin family protein n=1 Tax=uncultured Desulfovibrio sp. TaxID=167968 RepID=UPI002617AE64|nr:dynamin family protein [uncultured Desulfovibrio sp.]
MDYSRLRECLPQADRERFDTLWEQTGGNNSPLYACLAGAFSAGKTTLLNTLIGNALLPVAQEETTALPTFVEYAPAPRCELAGTDGATPIAPENLPAIIANPPQEARLVSVGLPLPWLQGLCLVDLPGSGSLDERNHEYSREQLRQADAVVYLLAPRGPSRDDLRNLTLLHTRGKKVLLGVAQWDRVEEAVARGEKEPDLAAWAADILYQTGLECAPCPVSRTGLGREQVIDFLQQTARELRDLRLRRFVAEARPMLTALLEHCQEAAGMLAADTEEARQQQHEELLRQKQELLETRRQAEKRRQEETQALLQRWDSGCEELSVQLEEGLRASAEQWTDKNGEEAFLERGETLLRETLAQAAALGQTLSQRYGQLEIPEAELRRRHLHLAPPQPVAAADFLDVGRLELLEKRMRGLQEQQRQAAKDTQASPDSLRAEIKEQELLLNDLQNQRQEILSAPLPRIETTEAATGSGQRLGRIIGEIADIGLLLAVPITAASKIGSLAGKAGKMIGMSARAAKQAAAVARAGTSVALHLNRAGQRAQIPQSRRGGGLIPPEVLDKIGKLDMLTLGYWGERIGSALDGEPVISSHTDPEALRRQQEALAKIDASLRERQLRIFDLEKELAAPRANIAAIEAEITSVRGEMEALAAQAEQKKATEEAARQREFQSMLAYEKKRCGKEWLHLFTQQSQSMRRLLQAMLHNWWEGYLPELLDEREGRVRELLEQRNKLPARRQQREAALRAEEEGVRQALRELEQ